MQEFVINDYLKLRLENDSTSIFVNNRVFSKCKYLLLNVPSYNIINGKDIATLYKADEHYNRGMEFATTPRELGLAPEEEYRGHCSNLQAWYESGYDPRLLHSNLAFPLLKKLTEAGDPLARNVFQGEVANKFSSGHSSVITYLIDEGYFDYLNIVEFENLISRLDFNVINIKGLCEGIIGYYKNKHGHRFLSTFIDRFLNRLKLKQAFFYFPLLKMLTKEDNPSIKQKFIEEIENRFKSGNLTVMTYLIIEGYMEYVEREQFQNELNQLNYPKHVYTLKGHMDRVNSICFSPDSGTLISCGGPFDKTVRLWDVKTGTLRNTLYGHVSDVNAVAVSPDGKRVFSASWDKTIKIWDVITGTLIQTLEGHSSWVRSVAVSRDGKYMVSGSGDRRGEDNSIRLWDLLTSLNIKSFKEPNNEVNAVEFSLDGNYIISGSSENHKKDFTIKIWEKSSGKLIREMEGYAGTVLDLKVSPDSKYVVSGSADNKVKVWDINTGKLLRTLQGHDLPVWSVAITFNGEHIVSGAGDGTVKVWEMESGLLVQTLIGHSLDAFTEGCCVYSVAISPDGKYIASGSMDNTIKLWKIDFSEL